jgi:hypothetical protein
MTIWTIEGMRPFTNRDARLLERARRYADEQLAERTVWCVAGLPGSHEAAWALRATLQLLRGEGQVAVDCLEIEHGEPMTGLARRVEAMLEGSADPSRGLSREDAADYADACRDGEALIGDAIAADDVVVLHDVLAAITAEAARDRGAHVIWRIDAAGSATAGEAWAFLHPREHGVDGYVGEWLEPGDAQGRVGAIVPSTRAVAARDVDTGQAPAGWGGALAQVVHSDRHETVGGTVHARPMVAIR